MLNEHQLVIIPCIIVDYVTCKKWYLATAHVYLPGQVLTSQRETIQCNTHRCRERMSMSYSPAVFILPQCVIFQCLLVPHLQDMTTIYQKATCILSAVTGMYKEIVKFIFFVENVMYTVRESRRVFSLDFHFKMSAISLNLS